MIDSKIIAVDFDNTLFKTCWPLIIHPNWPIIDMVKIQQEKGAKVILWTCRTGKNLDDALEACYRVGLHFDAVNANLPEVVEEFGEEWRKIFAHEYWDDLSWNPTNFIRGFDDNVRYISRHPVYLDMNNSELCKE